MAALQYCYLALRLHDCDYSKSIRPTYGCIFVVSLYSLSDFTSCYDKVIMLSLGFRAKWYTCFFFFILSHICNKMYLK